MLLYVRWQFMIILWCVWQTTYIKTPHTKISAQLAKMTHACVVVWLWDCVIVWLCYQVIFLCVPLNLPAKIHTFRHLTCWKWTELAKMAHACVIVRFSDCVIVRLPDCVIVWPSDFYVCTIELPFQNTYF